jgi:hypothetical protein
VRGCVGWDSQRPYLGLKILGLAASVFGIKNPYAVFGPETSEALRGLGEAVVNLGH